MYRIEQINKSMNIQTYTPNRHEMGRKDNGLKWYIGLQSSL